MTDTPSPLTRSVRSGVETDALGSVMPPVYLASNYAFRGLGEPGPYDYSRSSNPTRDVLAEALTTLEQGAGSVITGTGLGAVSVVAFATLEPGDTVLIPHDCYGGTWRFFDQMTQRHHFTMHTVDFTDQGALADAIETHRPTVVWIETPSNPLLRITDIAATCELAHRAGALVVADNTFLTPVGQQPLALGCDVVIHSTTKYINGHSDVVGGSITSATPELHERFAYMANTLGCTAGAFDAWLTMRGLRTLAPRMRQHQANALAVVDALNDHPAVLRVLHPSLESHAGHDLATRQQNGFGAMVSFELPDADAVRTLTAHLSLFSLAESLGGTESLVNHPVSMTHAGMTPAAQEAAGLTPGLVRLSVGLEEPEDLVADLRRGLDAVQETAPTN